MESAKVLMSLWLILSLLDLNIIDIISVGNHHIMKKYILSCITLGISAERL